MSKLEAWLEKLGFSEYLHAFQSEGFNRWEVVLDITEPDLSVATAMLR